MASRTTPGGDYDLSDPVNGFVDIVRRVVLQPSAFFAGLPRQGSLVGPLVFALICIEVSVFLVGLLTFLDVPGGVTWLFGARRDQGFLAFVGGLVIAPIAGAVGVFLSALVTHVLVILVVGSGHSGWGDLPGGLLLLGDEPPGLVTIHRVDLLGVPTLPGHRGDPRDALDDHG